MYKEFTLLGLTVALLKINQVGGTLKTYILMALNSRFIILDFAHKKLSLGIFFILSCSTERKIHKLLESSSIFVKNKTNNMQS